MQERLDSLVLKAKRRGSLFVDHMRALDRLKTLLADRAVVADFLDVEQTSVGSEADLPECGKVVQPFADLEVACVVDGGLGS
jgi:hypothetical protein